MKSVVCSWRERRERKRDYSFIAFFKYQLERFEHQFSMETFFLMHEEKDE